MGVGAYQVSKICGYWTEGGSWRRVRRIRRGEDVGGCMEVTGEGRKGTVSRGPPWLPGGMMPGLM